MENGAKMKKVLFIKSKYYWKEGFKNACKNKFIKLDFWKIKSYRRN
jgi:hypothetical protein